MGVLTSVICPTMGITAGAVFATAELKLVMISIIDRAYELHPCRVVVTLYVDDTAAESVGSSADMMKELPPFVLSICQQLEEDGMEVSRTKGLCTASSAALATEVETALKAFGVRSRRVVKSLGVHLGAGRRRTTQGTRERLADIYRRVRRYRQLRKMGVDTARLLRTGGGAAMTYGQATAGVSPTMLRRQRRVAASISVPGHGISGQNLDLIM